MTLFKGLLHYKQNQLFLKEVKFFAFSCKPPPGSRAARSRGGGGCVEERNQRVTEHENMLWLLPYCWSLNFRLEV